MIRRILIALRTEFIVFCLLALAAPGSAGAQERIALSVGGGASFPSKPDELIRYWQPGVGITGGIDYVLTSVLSLAGRVDYSRFALNADLLLSDLGAQRLGITLEGGEVSLILITGNLKVYPFPQIPEVRPYLMAGAGMANFDVRRVVISVADTSATVDGTAETALSVTLGAGFVIPLGNTLDLFTEARYILTYTSDEQTNVVPVLAGIRVKF